LVATTGGPLLRSQAVTKARAIRMMAKSRISRPP
jgi:hypothetical protein